MVISSDLGVSERIDMVLSSLVSSLNALSIIWSHGLPAQKLPEVARATTVATLM